MAHPLVTIDPDEIHGSGNPLSEAWARALVERVREAAAAGQTVTVSAEDTMLTPEQVGRRMNMHRSTIVRRILSGDIQAVKVGNRHRIPYAEFDRFRTQVLDDLARESAPDVEAELFGDA